MISIYPPELQRLGAAVSEAVGRLSRPLDLVLPTALHPAMESLVRMTREVNEMLRNPVGSVVRSHLLPTPAG